MKKLTESMALNWPSGYRAGEVLVDYPILGGTGKVIGAHLVTEIRAAARASAPNGGRASGGLQYLKDPSGEPYAVVFSSYSEDDILSIIPFGKWQGIKEIKHGFIGMKIYVLPSEGVTRKNPFASAVEFRLA